MFTVTVYIGFFIVLLQREIINIINMISRNEINSNGNGLVVIPIENLVSLTEEVKALREDLKSMVTPTSQLYTNRTLKELLGVGDKLIKQYRDNGLLSFTQVGDKFWYSKADIDNFLAVSHYEGWKINTK